MRKICLAVLFVGFIITGASAQSDIAAQADDYLTSLLDNTIRFDTVTPSNKVVAFDPETAWKNWRTIENYTYGKDRGSLPMIADLNSLHPYFRDKIYDLIAACKAQGIELAVVESFRTHAKQSEYFGMGRKYTRSKGGKSKHQYGLAVDVVPIVDGVAQWDNMKLWRRVGLAGERLGLRWGGRWKAPFDPAHFEWTGGATTVQLSRGVQAFIPKSKLSSYPCLEEELARLEKYWEAWEVEQAVSARNGAKVQRSVAGSKP